VEVSNHFSSLAEEDKLDWQLFNENLNAIGGTNPAITQPSKKHWLSQTSLDFIEENVLPGCLDIPVN